MSCCGRHNYCGRDCALLRSPPKYPRLLRAGEILFWLFILITFVTAPIAIFNVYAMWAGDCGAHGGHVAGAAFETRCEGSR